MSSVNSPISDLDAPQIVQREFDISNDAQRVNIVAGTLNVTNPSIGPNGSPAPVQSTEVGGIGADGNLHGISTDNSGNQNVNVVSSVLPTGAATSANQTTEITNLSAINAATTALNLRTSGSLVPFAQDYVGITVIPSGNGAGQVGTVIYKTGGASGITVATLSLVYDNNNNLISITRT